MSFHNHSFHSTLYLLTTQPGVHSGLMPFMPIQGVMTFSDNQQHLVEWYTTWLDTFGYVMWHHSSNDDVSTVWHPTPTNYSIITLAILFCEWICLPIPPLHIEGYILTWVLWHSRSVSKQSRGVEMAPPNSGCWGQSTCGSLLHFGISKWSNYCYYLLLIF